MAEARIPVDLTNPGQVFACLGFIEAADVLLGGASGGFDWTDPAAVMFCVNAEGEENPVQAVLEFLGRAELGVLEPPHSDTVFTSKNVALVNEEGHSFPVFPPTGTNTLPVVLKADTKKLILSHWADGKSGRETFKTFAGQQVAAEVYWKILRAKRGNPTKNEPDGKVLTSGFDVMFTEAKPSFSADPFAHTAALESYFGFDARGAWDAVRIGSSLDTQNVPSLVSPVVELLAPVGLSHARPKASSSYELEYRVWSGLLSPILYRAVFGGASGLSQSVRVFHAHMGNDKYYKKFFFAQETQP